MENQIFLLTSKNQVDYILDHADQENIQHGFMYSFGAFNKPTKYLGIDNTTGDLWHEEFDSMQACVEWLTEQKNSEHEFLIVRYIDSEGINLMWS